jgi:hypothetical protein
MPKLGLSTLLYSIDRESLLAAMRVTSGLVPILMIIAVLSIYVGWLYPNPPPLFVVAAGIQALLVGTFLGCIGWLCAILVARHFVTIDRANSAVYSELRSRFTLAQHLGQKANTELDEKEKVAKLEDEKEKAANASATQNPSKHTAANEGLLYTRMQAMACIERLKEVLSDEVLPAKNTNDRGVHNWVEGSGYITAWEELHRVEEALIVLAPLETVIADSYSDELRLEGSNIDNRDVLLTRLRENVRTLEKRLCGEKMSKASQSESEQGDTVEITPIMEVLAREKLRHVRRAINQFRDERRRGLVRARNRLNKTITVTGLVVFLLVALAVLLCVQPVNIVAAATFYLVGAVMGLFNQLYLDGSTETATEDYGLAAARLFHTPMISGLAALGGALAIPMLSVLANSSTNATPDLGTIPSLATILNLTDHPFSLVLAAIFGLSPTVLISRLQQEAEKYKADLKGTESPTRRSSVQPPP